MAVKNGKPIRTFSYLVFCQHEDQLPTPHTNPEVSAKRQFFFNLLVNTILGITSYDEIFPLCLPHFLTPPSSILPIDSNFLEYFSITLICNYMPPAMRNKPVPQPASLPLSNLPAGSEVARDGGEGRG